MNSKIILQLGAGAFSIGAIIKLRKLGYIVYAVDQNPKASGFKHTDGSAPIDIVNTDEIIKYARKIKANALYTVTEFGVLSAAIAADKLNLSGISPETALNCIDKGLMRTVWQKANLPQPRYFILNNKKDISAAIKEIGYPVVIKPTRNCGSRGVSVINDHQEINQAVEYANKFNATTHQYIVEKVVPGKEMTIEGLVQKGEVIILAKSDKEHQRHPNFRVAMALNYPAKFKKWQLKRAEEIVIKAVKSIGIIIGAFHVECMINEEDVFLIEIASRPGGAHIFTHVVELTSGICMPQALVSILLNEEKKISSLVQKGACYKFFTPPQGIFISASGIKEASVREGIVDIGFKLNSGSTIGPIEGDSCRPGYVVAQGGTRAMAINNANAAIHCIQYHMEPLSFISV